MTVELSIGELIDRLTIVNIKIFHLVDIVEANETDAAVADAARKAQVLNRERSQLINAINACLGSKHREVKL